MMNLFSSKYLSNNIARERLKLILIHDRTDISSNLLDLIKYEIVQVINNYIEIDVSDVKVKLTQSTINEGGYSILVANIPLKR